MKYWHQNRYRSRSSKIETAFFILVILILIGVMILNAWVYSHHPIKFIGLPK